MTFLSHSIFILQNLLYSKMTYMPHSGYTPSGSGSLDFAVARMYIPRSSTPLSMLETVVQYEKPGQTGVTMFDRPVYKEPLHTHTSSKANNHSEYHQSLQPQYGGSAKTKEYLAQLSAPQAVYHSPDAFLKPQRPVTVLVGKSEEIRSYIAEAFTATTGKKLDDANVVIEVLPRKAFKQRFKLFGGKWSEGIQGFSINHEGREASLIFVKEDHLDKVMITVGHEIGHIMSARLSSKVDEEAKAFAFELAWINVLYNKNIAGLRSCINIQPQPAQNGVHDVGFNFVRSLILLDYDPLAIFTALTNGALSSAQHD